MSANVHATAIVVGSTGILITGPSGAGKSAIALSLLSTARMHRLHAALVADDQVFLRECGGRILAEAPAATAGLIEMRGTGIAHMDHIEAAVLDFAVRIVPAERQERMPEAPATFALEGGFRLPLLVCPWPSPDPFFRLAAACPGLETGGPARPGLLPG